MKILFLHGWYSIPGGVKPSYLSQHGHEVINPALDDDDWDQAVCTAQAEYDRHRPDVIVGSSRGGAVAMNIDSGTTPLVLLCPAWRRWGRANTVKPGTVSLHSEADGVIPIDDSRELVRASGQPESADGEVMAICLGRLEKVTPCEEITGRLGLRNRPVGSIPLDVLPGMFIIRLGLPRRRHSP